MKTISKKTISLLLAVMLALSLSVTAFATDTTIMPDASTGDPTPESGNIAISHEVTPTYTVTIPASVTIGDSATISASDVVVGEGSTLQVSITATSADNGEDFTIASSDGSGDDTVEYTVKSGSTSYNLGDPVLTVDPASSDSGSVALTFALADGETPTYSGTYSGTMTFTVAIS